MRIISNWKKQRKRFGLTLEKAAREMGITKAQLSHIERGRSGTSREVMAHACELYGCQPGDLFIAEAAVPERTGDEKDSPCGQ